MFCWMGWHFVDRFGFANSCDYYLKSGPFSVVHHYNSSKNYTLYPGECINLNQDFIVRDYWGHDITNETSLVVDVLVGTARAINNDGCHCVIFNDSNPGFVRCNDQHVLLLPDLSSTDYTKDTSRIMIHPPKILGITAYVHFDACEYGVIINKNWGCACELLLYTKVCTKKSLLTCTICFDENSNCTSYSNGWGMCGSCNDIYRIRCGY